MRLNNLGQFRAYIEKVWHMGGVRLQLVRDVRPGWIEVLAENGELVTVEEGAEFPANTGIHLPEEAVIAIAEATQKHLGNALPSQAEIAVLREWLTKEQSRVDTIFEERVRD